MASMDSVMEFFVESNGSHFTVESIQTFRDDYQNWKLREDNRPFHHMALFFGRLLPFFLIPIWTVARYLHEDSTNLATTVHTHIVGAPSTRFLDYASDCVSRHTDVISQSNSFWEYLAADSVVVDEWDSLFSSSSWRDFSV